MASSKKVANLKFGTTNIYRILVKFGILMGKINVRKLLLAWKQCKPDWAIFFSKKAPMFHFHFEIDNSETSILGR